MGSNFQKELEEILADNRSGSSELVVRIALLLKQKLTSEKSIESELNIISDRVNEFAIIDSLIASIRNLPAEKQLNLLNQFLNEQSSVYQVIYKKLKPHITKAPKIVTLSNSKTIIELIRLIYSDFPSAVIYVSESRPVNEGALMSEALADIGLDVTLITEAMLPEFVSKSSFALIGADKILTNGNVVNKIGSRLLAILCRFFNKPFYAVADKRKITQDDVFIQKPHPGDEIYTSENSKIKVAENYYFEIVEAELITEIFTNQ